MCRCLYCFNLTTKSSYGTNLCPMHLLWQPWARNLWLPANTDLNAHEMSWGGSPWESSAPLCRENNPKNKPILVLAFDYGWEDGFGISSNLGSCLSWWTGYLCSIKASQVSHRKWLLTLEHLWSQNIAFGWQQSPVGFWSFITGPLWLKWLFVTQFILFWTI